MRFSAASLLALAAGAVASSSTITEVVTTYETYCPEATSFVSGSSTVHVTTPGTFTMTGSYTVTRPLLSSTVTICNACSSTAPAVPLGTGTPRPYTSTQPGSPGTPGSTTSPATPPMFTNGAASNAVAGAGAGLAAVFGAAAVLL